jgi:hypothetical protein
LTRAATIPSAGGGEGRNKTNFKILKNQFKNQFFVFVFVLFCFVFVFFLDMRGFAFAAVFAAVAQATCMQECNEMTFVTVDNQPGGGAPPRCTLSTDTAVARGPKLLMLPISCQVTCCAPPNPEHPNGACSTSTSGYCQFSISISNSTAPDGTPPAEAVAAGPCVPVPGCGDDFARVARVAIPDNLVANSYEMISSPSRAGPGRGPQRVTLVRG